MLEVGARSCWPSLQLLREGHSVAAVGVDLDAERGLLAVDPLVPAGALLPRAEGEMESLPLEPGLFDLVVAHDSLHYAPRPVRALLEIRRVTRRGGVLLAFESPVFRRRGEGEARVADHMREQSQRYNFPVPREAEPGYLVLGELREMFRSAGWSLEIHGWPSRAAEWVTDLRDFLHSGGRRPRSPLLLARRDG
ncbi:MAG TPA: class I SAM-dependent methyltransferase [Vicinamibacteria bacterium]|nr:class I SAM-dependent methyltransferase [Vicinamibacteria bacterium]